MIKTLNLVRISELSPASDTPDSSSNVKHGCLLCYEFALGKPSGLDRQKIQAVELVVTVS